MWVWAAGLFVLALINPESHSHFTLCPFKNMGIDYCPGCGLGRSISLLFHGEIEASIKTHILGVPAVIILSSRIASLFNKSAPKVPIIINNPERQNNAKHLTNNAIS